jgi:ectoine hydroxylase-related dioxygenase (phytanoyl-CoA dioxygenase family)
MPTIKTTMFTHPARVAMWVDRNLAVGSAFADLRFITLPLYVPSHPMSEFSILEEDYPLSDSQIEFYRVNGFVKLRNVLSTEVIEHFGKIVSEAVVELNTMHLPLEERSTYDRAFLQVMNIWRKNEAVKPLVFSTRLAGIAARLMGTRGTRLYHDQGLYKEPGGGFTPWHADQFYWPLTSEKTATVWIPLQATPIEMGPLEFAARSQSMVDGRDIGISDDSEERIDRLVREGAYERVSEAFQAGEVSFHTGWTFHRAGPNSTDSVRRVMTVIYMDRDMQLKRPENENQQADWDAWCPGATIGEPIDTPLNPVLN